MGAWSNILLPGIVGTTFMTTFSFALAESEKKKFEEPILLNKMTKKLVPLNFSSHHPTGWLLHYSTGIVFAAVSHQVWKRTKLKPGLGSGLLMGALAGLAGIGIWKIAFKIHPDPPAHFSLKDYYGHLFVAHLIFGITSAMTSRKLGYGKMIATKKIQRVDKTEKAVSKP